MIVVVGEALVDLVVETGGAITANLGGGPYNSARTLGRLDVPVAYLGRLSTDAFGRGLRTALDDDGVDASIAPTTNDPTTLALAEIDGHGTASYRFYIDGTSVPGLTAEDAFAALADVDVTALHVGTLGLVFRPFADAAEAVVAHYADRSLIFIDPNIRPSVIADRVGYEARLGRVLANADVVKVSDEDLDWLKPGVTPLDAARWLLEAGPSLALVTLGREGVLVVTDSFAEQVMAPKVDVVDTIGAGDAFGGGVLAWWHDHGRPDLTERSAAVQAATFGCRVAAATCGVRGANPPRRAELETP